MASYFASDDTSEPTTFQREIANMMHGFGDNPNPNAATVVLIENIVLQQIMNMLQEASSNTVKRSGKGITNFDVIFLMRKNKMKLKRLHDYQLKMNDIEKNREKAESIDYILVEAGLQPRKKKRRTHIDIINELDECDEVSQIKFDAIDYKRKVRASKITETMSFEKYKAYHKSRCVSFRTPGDMAKGFSKFERWINPKKEWKITKLALEVLCFLAYETVAEIVDGIFLVRQDAKKRIGDPFSKFEGGHFCNPPSLNNAVYIKSGYEGVPAITVAEVREVLRRFYSPRTVLSMEEWDIVTNIDAGEEVEKQAEGMDDCATADVGNLTEMLPVSRLKRTGDNATEQVKVPEEKPLTIIVPTSPKSTVANTMSADVEPATIDSALVLNEELEEGPSQSSQPTLQESSSANTPSADVQQANIDSDSVLTIVLEKESSGSISAPISPKSSEPNTASGEVSQEANNDSDSVLTVVLEEEFSGSNSVPIWPKSSIEEELSRCNSMPISPKSSLEEEPSLSNRMPIWPKSSIEEELSRCNSMPISPKSSIEEELSRSDIVPTSQKSPKPNTASADVAQQENNDAPLVLKEELEEKPSTSGSVSIWKKSTVPCTVTVGFEPVDVDPINVHEEEKSATEENQNEAMILNDKTLLAQSLIAKLMNLLSAKRLSELNLIQNKSNSRKRPREAEALETCGSSTSDPLTRGLPPHTMTPGSTNIMDYYISKYKDEGKDCDCSQLLIDNPGLVMELNYYTERMKAFIMLPVKYPKESEQIEESNPSTLMENSKRARKEDETNGAQTSKVIDLT